MRLVPWREQRPCGEQRSDGLRLQPRVHGRGRHTVCDVCRGQVQGWSWICWLHQLPRRLVEARARFPRRLYSMPRVADLVAGGPRVQLPDGSYAAFELGMRAMPGRYVQTKHREQRVHDLSPKHVSGDGRGNLASSLSGLPVLRSVAARQPPRAELHVSARLLRADPAVHAVSSEHVPPRQQQGLDRLHLQRGILRPCWRRMHALSVHVAVGARQHPAQ